MRFNLVDRIVSVKPGKVIEALKNLTLGEDYLADHFPTFPVLPGVLMLESLVEAGAWLLRITHDFEKSLIVLHEVRNIKYASFVEPGQQMQVSMNLVDIDLTPVHVVFEAIRREAESAHVEIAGSEFIGLVPKRAVEQAAAYHLKLEQMEFHVLPW